jgi:type I restriction enzyme S subunit
MNQQHTNNHHSQIPQGWSWVRLGDLCVEDKKIVEPASEVAAHLPYLSLEHIESNTGRILRHPSEFVEDEGQSTTFAFDQRHILYGKLRPYLNKVAIPNFYGRCTTELIPFLPLLNVSRHYLAWLFRHPNTVAVAMKGKTGSRMPRANIKELLSCQVLLPNCLAEQERLADIMDSQMNHIQRAKNACLEQLKLIEELSLTTLSNFPLEI